MIDFSKSPLGADTLLMNVGAFREPDAQHWRMWCGVGLRSVSAGAVPIAMWMIWRHGDVRDVVAAAAVTLGSALVGLFRLRSPTAALYPAHHPPVALSETMSPQIRPA